MVCIGERHPLSGRARERHSKEPHSEQVHPATEYPKKRYLFTSCLRVVPPHLAQPTACLYFVSMLSKQHLKR